MNCYTFLCNNKIIIILNKLWYMIKIVRYSRNRCLNVEIFYLNEGDALLTLKKHRRLFVSFLSRLKKFSEIYNPMLFTSRMLSTIYLSFFLSFILPLFIRPSIVSLLVQWRSAPFKELFSLFLYCAFSLVKFLESWKCVRDID